MQPQRLLDNLCKLASFTATPGVGVTRFSWSVTDSQARGWLVAELRAMAIEPFVDGAGNLHARLKGKRSGAPIYLGSHLDSVRHGGHLDGAYGVVAGLETLRSLRETGFTPCVDVEMIAFAEEEGSNCGCTCLGSKAVTGLCSVEDLQNLRDPQGKSAFELMQTAGLYPENLPNEQIISGTAFLEAHIEQNAVLERGGHSVGIVTAICGMRLHRITLRGKSDHAASPMEGRRDPVAGFVHFFHGIGHMQQNGVLPKDFSFTVGTLHCAPDVVNVIPELVEFTVDIRHVDVAVLEAGWQVIAALLKASARTHNLEMDCWRVSASGGVAMDANLTERLQVEAERLGKAPYRLPSGPAHDAACMARVMPAAMIFVPSRAGLSHCPQEDTAPEELVLGARILENTLRTLTA